MALSLKERVRVNMEAITPLQKPTDPLHAKRVIKARRSLKNLRNNAWNGFSELTDQSKFGHVLLNADGPSDPIKFTGAFKNQEREREIDVIRHSGFNELYVSITRASRRPNVISSILSCLQDGELDRYYNESVLVTQLVEKIAENKAVRGRWLPSFAPSLDVIDERLNSRSLFNQMAPVLPNLSRTYMRPTTLGQWFLGAVVNRIRQRHTAGIGLKTLLFAITWLLKTIQEGDVLCIHSSAVTILAWIESSTCDDCMLKTLFHSAGRTIFPYDFNNGDSFSDYITFKHDPTNVYFTQCGSQAGIANAPSNVKSCALTPIGSHALLTSATANVMTTVSVRTDVNGKYVQYRMTSRQFFSLCSVLDLHARVLRSMQWRKESEVYDTWISERKIQLDLQKDDLTEVILIDLIHIARTSTQLETTVAFLSTLLLTKKLSAAFINAYRNEWTSFRDAHSFVICYAFTRAPSPDDYALAVSLIEEATTDPTNLKRRLSSEIDRPIPLKTLKLSKDDIDILQRWNIAAADELDIDDNYDGNSIVIERTHSESPCVPLEEGACAASLIDKYDLVQASDLPSSVKGATWRTPNEQNYSLTSSPSESSMGVESAPTLEARMDELASTLEKSFHSANVDAEAASTSGLDSSVESRSGYVTPPNAISTISAIQWSDLVDDD